MNWHAWHVEEQRLGSTKRLGLQLVAPKTCRDLDREKESGPKMRPMETLMSVVSILSDGLSWQV